MIDAVSRKNHQRPIGGKAAFDQSCGQGINNEARLFVGYFSPTLANTFGKEYSPCLTIDC